MNEAASRPAELFSDIELRSSLQTLLVANGESPRRIVKLKRSRSDYSSSHPIEELDVGFDDGAGLRLILKNYGGEASHRPVRTVRPEFLHAPLREIAVYESILCTNAVDAPCFFGAIVDEEADRYGLLLEALEGVRLDQIGDVEHWCDAARWLAVLHRHFQERPPSVRQKRRLANYRREHFEMWITRAQAFADSATRRELDGLALRYDRLVSRLAKMPRTFIHGEFFPSNILIQKTGDRVRVRAVDWETAGMGPGLIDLAALISGRWAGDEPLALASAYREAIPVRDGWPPSEKAFLEQLDCCRLHLAVQMLGWSRHWTPPPDHRHDWLNEALSIAQRLNL